MSDDLFASWVIGPFKIRRRRYYYSDERNGHTRYTVTRDGEYRMCTSTLEAAYAFVERLVAAEKQELASP